MESILGSGRLSVGTHRVELISYKDRMAVFMALTKTGAHASELPEGVELQVGKHYTVTVAPHGALLHRPNGLWAFVEMEYGIPVAELTPPVSTLQEAVALLTDSEYTGSIADFVIKEIRDGEQQIYTAHPTRAAIRTSTPVRSFEVTRSDGRTTNQDQTT